MFTPQTAGLRKRLLARLLSASFRMDLRAVLEGVHGPDVLSVIDDRVRTALKIWRAGGASDASLLRDAAAVFAESLAGSDTAGQKSATGQLVAYGAARAVLWVDPSGESTAGIGARIQRLLLPPLRDGGHAEAPVREMLLAMLEALAPEGSTGPSGEEEQAAARQLLALASDTASLPPAWRNALAGLSSPLCRTAARVSRDDLLALLLGALRTHAGATGGVGEHGALAPARAILTGALGTWAAGESASAAAGRPYLPVGAEQEAVAAVGAMMARAGETLGAPGPQRKELAVACAARLRATALLLLAQVAPFLRALPQQPWAWEAARHAVRGTGLRLHDRSRGGAAASQRERAAIDLMKAGRHLLAVLVDECEVRATGATTDEGAGTASRGGHRAWWGTVRQIHEGLDEFAPHFASEAWPSLGALMAMADAPEAVGEGPGRGQTTEEEEDAAEAAASAAPPLPDGASEADEGAMARAAALCLGRRDRRWVGDVIGRGVGHRNPKVRARLVAALLEAATRGLGGQGPLDASWTEEVARTVVRAAGADRALVRGYLAAHVVERSAPRAVDSAQPQEQAPVDRRSEATAGAVGGEGEGRGGHGGDRQETRHSRKVRLRAANRAHSQRVRAEAAAERERVMAGAAAAAAAAPVGPQAEAPTAPGSAPLDVAAAVEARAAEVEAQQADSAEAEETRWSQLGVRDVESGIGPYLTRFLHAYMQHCDDSGAAGLARLRWLAGEVLACADVRAGCGASAAPFLLSLFVVRRNGADSTAPSDGAAAVLGDEGAVCVAEVAAAASRASTAERTRAFALRAGVHALTGFTRATDLRPASIARALVALRQAGDASGPGGAWYPAIARWLRPAAVALADAVPSLGKEDPEWAVEAALAAVCAAEEEVAEAAVRGLAAAMQGLASAATSPYASPDDAARSREVAHALAAAATRSIEAVGAARAHCALGVLWTGARAQGQSSASDLADDAGSRGSVLRGAGVALATFSRAGAHGALQWLAKQVRSGEAGATAQAESAAATLHAVAKLACAAAQTIREGEGGGAVFAVDSDALQPLEAALVAAARQHGPWCASQAGKQPVARLLVSALSPCGATLAALLAAAEGALPGPEAACAQLHTCASTGAFASVADGAADMPAPARELHSWLGLLASLLEHFAPGGRAQRGLSRGDELSTWRAVAGLARLAATGSLPAPPPAAVAALARCAACALETAQGPVAAEACVAARCLLQVALAGRGSEEGTTLQGSHYLELVRAGLQCAREQPRDRRLAASLVSALLPAHALASPRVWQGPPGGSAVVVALEEMLAVGMEGFDALLCAVVQRVAAVAVAAAEGADDSDASPTEAAVPALRAVLAYAPQLQLVPAPTGPELLEPAALGSGAAADDDPWASLPGRGSSLIAYVGGVDLVPEVETRPPRMLALAALQGLVMRATGYRPGRAVCMAREGGDGGHAPTRALLVSLLSSLLSELRAPALQSDYNMGSSVYLHKLRLWQACVVLAPAVGRAESGRVASHALVEAMNNNPPSVRYLVELMLTHLGARFPCEVWAAGGMHTALASPMVAGSGTSVVIRATHAAFESLCAQPDVRDGSWRAGREAAEHMAAASTAWIASPDAPVRAIALLVLERAEGALFAGAGGGGGLGWGPFCAAAVAGLLRQLRRNPKYKALRRRTQRFLDRWGTGWGCDLRHLLHCSRLSRGVLVPGPTTAEVRAPAPKCSLHAQPHPLPLRSLTSASWPPAPLPWTWRACSCRPPCSPRRRTWSARWQPCLRPRTMSAAP